MEELCRFTSMYHLTLINFFDRSISEKFPIYFPHIILDITIIITNIIKIILILIIYLFTSVDATACLKAHNNRRALHGTPALVWNNSLTQHAQEWAEYLLSKGSPVHASGIDEGENLAWGYGPTFRTCVQAMEGWLIYLIFVCYRYRFFFAVL